MSALLVALFILGVGSGLIARAWKPRRPQKQRQSYQNDNLDTVDEMFLYGEATEDEFYRM
jgi:hypothetical protein